MLSTPGKENAKANQIKKTPVRIVLKRLNSAKIPEQNTVHQSVNASPIKSGLMERTNSQVANGSHIEESLKLTPNNRCRSFIIRKEKNMNSNAITMKLKKLRISAEKSHCPEGVSETMSLSNTHTVAKSQMKEEVQSENPSPQTLFPFNNSKIISCPTLREDCKNRYFFPDCESEERDTISRKMSLSDSSRKEIVKNSHISRLSNHILGKIRKLNQMEDRRVYWCRQLRTSV